MSPLTLLRKISLSSATWFLVALISIILFWCHSTINQYPYQSKTLNNQEILVRVLNSKNTSFGLKEYSILWNNQTWIIKNNSQNLSTGANYKLEINSTDNYLDTIKTNSFNRYNYSLGIQGEIKSISSIKLINCDFVCFLINSTNQIRNNLQIQLLLNNCHNNYYIIEFLQQDSQTCQDISYLGYGLILGGSNNLDKIFKQNIKKIGLTHLIAFSGFQVVIICSLLEFGLTKTGFNRLTRLIITAIILSITIILVGPQPPVLRSSIGILILESLLFFTGKKIFAIHRLIYSSLILLILNPFYSINLSFQLSILATLGLVLSSSLINQVSKKINQNFWLELITQTTGAWILTLPIIIMLNEQINMLQIISNILIIPIIPISSALILLTVIPLIGSFFGFFNTLILTCLQILINDLAKINQLNFVFKSNLTLTDIIVYYSLILMIWIAIYSQKASFKGPKKSQ